MSTTTGTDRRRGSRPPPTSAGRGWTVVLALGLMALAGAGCSGLPFVPHPTAVRVPYPDDVTAATDREEIYEMYSVSPLLDPDGWGELDTLYEQSFISLIPYEAIRQREERNKLAYARTEGEQRTKLAEMEILYRDHVIFEGILVGDFAILVDLENYLPEGVYILDDEGRKFLPESVVNLEPWFAIFYSSGDFGTANWAYPRFKFPGETITRATRAITLYFALYEKRMALTWIFDPGYVPPASPFSSELRRRFSTDR